MNIIQEDYVSFEVAKLLKEKGFDGQTVRAYNLKKKLCKCQCNPGETINSTPNYLIAAPTFQMACKWLREIHNLFIFPFPQRNTNKFWTEIFQLSNNQEWENLYCESIHLQDYSTYEEAVEAALKYTLKNLI